MNIFVQILLVALALVATYIFAKERTFRKYAEIKAKKEANRKKRAKFFAGLKANGDDAQAGGSNAKWIAAAIVVSVFIVMFGAIIIALIVK